MTRIDYDGCDALLLNLGHRLHAYLRDRARVTGGKYEATPQLLADAYLLGGVRVQCGVIADDHANLLADLCEPRRGYFDEWMRRHRD